MALRRLLFQSLAAGSGYFDSTQDADDVKFNSFTVAMGTGTGTALDLNTNDIANVRKITLLTGVAGIGLDAGGLRLNNLATPTANSDAATKAYVDGLASGVDWKASVRAALTTNLANPTTAPGASVGGVTMVANDRFLLTGQGTPSENGIYVWTNATTAARAADAAAGQLTTGAATYVSEGTNAGTAWILTTPDPITVGSTGQTWTQFAGTALYTANNGVTLSGKNFSGVANTAAGIGVDGSGFKLVLNGANPGLAFTSTYVDIKYGYGLQASAQGVAILLDSNPGLTSTATGLKAVAGNGIGITSGIAVTPDTTKGIAVSGSGVAIQLNGTNPGLAFTSTYVDVKYGNGTAASATGITAVGNAAQGINVGASGIGITLATNPGLYFNTGLSVQVVANTGLSLGASGISGVANAAQGLNVGASGFGITLGTNPGLQFSSGLLLLTTSSGAAGTAGGLVVGATGLGLSLASSTPGLTTTSGLAVLIDATTVGGLTANANGLAIKLNGTTLQISTSTGISVKGLPSLFEVNAVATSANVTAANLNTLTGGADASALHTHAGLSASAVAWSATVGAGGVTKGDVLYISASDTVLKGDPTNVSKSVIVGIAQSTQSAAASVGVQTDGVLAGAGSGWTAGQQIFMSAAGGLTNDPTALASRSRTIMVGIAKNTTDLAVSIRDLGMKP